MATMLQPFAPWMRDLSRFMNTPGAASAFLPPADVIVSDSGVTVYMDVPGLKAEDLDIELENDMLTVRGERRPPWENLDDCAARIERAFGAFERTLRVTSGLDPEAIEAGISDGVLTLHLPKPAHPEPRRIEIRRGSAIGNGSASQPAGEATAGEPQSEGSASQPAQETEGSASQPAQEPAGAPTSEGTPSGAAA
jgi:HSP20 family protein